VTWSGRDEHPLREGEGHDVTVVVVGMLPNQIDPARSSPDPGWPPPNPGTKVLNQGVGVIAHGRHCIGRKVLITSADGLPQ
jgi:hypothetical protein